MDVFLDEVSADADDLVALDAIPTRTRASVRKLLGEVLGDSDVAAVRDRLTRELGGSTVMGVLRIRRAPRPGGWGRRGDVLEAREAAPHRRVRSHGHRAGRLREQADAVVAQVRPRRAKKQRCGRCGRRAPGYDQGEGRRRWRALDLGEVRLFVEADELRFLVPARLAGSRQNHLMT
jgi:hypothetical protein